MPDIKATLIKGDKTQSNVEYRDLLPVNMYAVNRKILDADGYFLNYPGLVSFASGVTGVDRGAVYNERMNRHFRVIGNDLIELNELGNVSVLGTIDGDDQVSMPYSFNTQAIIANGKMWLYSPSTGLNQITDPDLGNPIDGIWIDQYYFLTDGEYIYHTNISDETAIDPLKYSTAEFDPDDTIGLSKTQDNKVMVWGRHSIEYFVDVATANFAFKRVETRAQKIGLVSTHAKVECQGAFYIIGGRLNEQSSVYRVTLGAAEKVATREIDQILIEYSDSELENVRIEQRLENDITFVLIHLPNHTLCFNESIAKTIGIQNAWSILKTGTGNLTYRAINGIYDTRINKWIYGDKYNSTIGYLDPTICTQYNSIAEWILYTPFFRLETLSVNEMEINIVSGYNNNNDATLAMSMTYDGVHWSKEYWMQYDSYTDYQKRFIIRRLGNINNYAGFKLRGVSKSRMAFALMRLNVS